MENTQYINKELSWVDFNKRVLDEACNEKLPLMEQLKFIAITSSNFDEFFMVRMASLYRAINSGKLHSCPSGLSNEEILNTLSENIHAMMNRQEKHLMKKLLPTLKEAGLRFIKPDKLTHKQISYLEQHFINSVMPVLTPRKIEEEQKLIDMVTNKHIEVVFLFKNGDKALIQVPGNLQRFIQIEEKKHNFVLLEDLICYFGNRLFPGKSIHTQISFRLTRDADMSVDEERDEDFMSAMEEVIQERDHSFPVRLEIRDNSPDLKLFIKENLGLSDREIYSRKAPLSLKDFMQLSFLSGLTKYQIPGWNPQIHPELDDDTPLWETLRKKDILLHHPYDSYKPVIRMVKEAADDEDTVAIKMTLYRTSGDSPIVKALIKAAENGKQVVVLVELKARFDEGQNLHWADKLRKAGAVVIYGVTTLKVHAKAIYIVRRESGSFRSYLHMGTGNYNDSTAKLYVDMGLMTCRKELCRDAMLFFNAITGYSDVSALEHLAMAPFTLRKKQTELIEREMERAAAGQKAVITAKMNSLVDEQIINHLYKASQAGVKIKLNVRGMCSLVPGVKGLSENITVISVIDRYLEHTRAFHFHNNGEDEVYMSSADWMTRNLDKRVELLFPVSDISLKKEVLDCLKVYFTDNSQAWELHNNGQWKRKSPDKGEKKIRVQELFYNKAVKRAGNLQQKNIRSFKVRRDPV